MTHNHLESNAKLRTFRHRGAIALGVLLAVACGKSASNGGHSGVVDNGAGEAGTPPASSGGKGNAGSASGGVSGVAGTAVGGEPSSAGASEGGSPGEAGNAGQAASAGGEGGAPSEPLPTPVCDDGNACTLDSFVAGSCHHDAAPNGQPCEDGSLCTLGDHCAAGICTPGTLQTGAGHALGSVETYGLDLAVTPGDNRFAFVDAFANPARLTLAEVANGTLEKRDQVVITQSVGFSFIATAWDDLIAVADGDTSFGLNGPSRNLQLFSIANDGKLTPYAIVPITPGSVNNPANTSMVGRGSRLFLCHNWSFFSAPAGTLMWWDVSDPDVPVLIAQGSTNGQCGSIAASDDGTRVYVNTVNGVLWTDLSTWTTGDLTFAADPLVATDAGLSVRGDRLVARSGELLRVFDESDHTLLNSFTVPGANGAAVTDAGIFVEADVAVGDGTENTIAEYGFSGDLIQRLVVSQFAFKRDIASVKPIAGQGYAMDVLTHRLFAVGTDGFDEIEEPEVGAMNQIFAGQDALHARGSLAAHRIDVSDPTAPAIVAGGPTRDPAVHIKLDVSLTPAALVPEIDPTARFFSGADPATVSVSPSLGHATQTLLETVSADADEHLVPGDALQLPGGPTTLQSVGDFIYRSSYISGDGVHLQRWQIADLKAGIHAPVMDVKFDAPTSATTPTIGFDIDPRARVAVLSNTLASEVYWIDLATDPPTVTETLTANATSLRVSGDQLVFGEPNQTGTRLHFVQRGTGADVAIDLPSRITRLLAFDGATAYYAVDTALRAVTHKPLVPLTVTLDLPTRSAVSSLAAMPGTLAAASAGELLTFAPVCE